MVNPYWQRLPRRGFLRSVLGGSAVTGLASWQAWAAEPSSRPAAQPAVVTGQSPGPGQSALSEHGFWDYTTPAAGGMERFAQQDYILLLDDMAAAGMNSLVICPKWMTTGYRSRLPYLDQTPDNPVIASDNALLRLVIGEARSRHIKVWLLAVVNMFDADRFGLTPCLTQTKVAGYPFPFARLGVYEADLPEIPHRAAEVCRELVELFPGIGGLVVELEFDNLESPRRIPLYDAWARANGRQPFAQIAHPLNPRGTPIDDWRDYTTHTRLVVFEAIQDAVRGAGFSGDFGLICGLGGRRYDRSQEVNLEMLHRRQPAVVAVTYNYTKTWHRYAEMELGVALPRKLGIRTHFLPRGVMTWDLRGLDGMALADHWALDAADVRMFQPHGLWWFGSGTVNDGAHVSLTTLRKLGYRDGTAARRALLGVLRAYPNMSAA